MISENDNEHSIIDYLEEVKDDSFNKTIYTILIHLALILGVYFGRDYFIEFHLNLSEKYSYWLVILSWVFLLLICLSLSKKLFKILARGASFTDWQIPLLTFLTFLASRVIFLTTLYLVLGPRVKFPETLIDYFQGLMVAGLFGFVAYDRIKKYKGESQKYSIVLLVAYYLCIRFIESQIS